MPLTHPREFGRYAAPWTVCRLLWQGRRARGVLPLVPEADGPTAGEAGNGSRVRRLLVVGESTAAGVGARDHVRGLAGQVASRLATLLDARVAWTVLGRTGLTAARVRRELVPTLAPMAVDAIVLALGANDAAKLTPVGVWQRELTGLCADLRAHVGPAPIVLSRAPPFECSPTLPDPLRTFLGFRCARINTASAGFAPSIQRLQLSAEPVVIAPGEFAPDGFHPNEAGYARWGAHLADCLAEFLD
jgi:lysophospholipase L1-like esterase